MSKRIRYLVSGGLAGLTNGLFGAGGGMLLVPLLSGWCALDQRAAFANSVAIIFPLSLVSAAIYWLHGALDLPAALPYLVGGAAGGWIAGRIFRQVKLLWLRRAFGLLILYGGVRTVLGL